MSDHDYETVEDLFIRCLEKEDTKQQREWLQEQCKGQAELFSEVYSLLQAHSDSDEFLADPIKFETLSIDEQSAFRQQRDNQYIGETIGVYQIDSLLGRGGMGSVYLAHRNDGEYEQEVAIKVVESSTLETMLFRRERQILAQLNHPNIVTLLDGGTLPDGSSYFVMERVDGLNIDEHIKQKKLDARQVLRLIIKLGLVIQEAHQHGIIHCDIKPANILVTDEGVLKLLDFGIAQHLSQAAKQVSETKPKRFALTPEYSSPRRHQQYMPVISDDVFSLGILLAHALSGKVPAIIVSDFTPFPEPDIEKTAAYITDSELKQVFLKATHPAEKQRYASAKSFVNDLQSWLGHYPISAVGNGGYYGLKKHVRRNWRYWGIASALLISLIVASTTWVHKQRLEEESLQVQKITKGMLLDLDNSLEALPHTTLIRKKLIETANRRVDQFSQQAPSNLAIKKMQADTLERLAEVTGHPYALNQGDIDGALKYYQQALKIYQHLLGEQGGNLSAEIDVANTQRKIAEIKAYQGDIDGGLKIMGEVRVHMEKVFANVSIERQLPMLILYTVEAHGYFHKGDLKKAEDLIEQAWAIAYANKQEEPKYFLILAFLHEETGHLALLTGREGNAKQEYLAVIEKYQDNDMWQHKRRLARVHNGLACIALKNNDITAVEHHFQQTWQAFAELNEKYPKVNSIENKLNNLNVVYENMESTDRPSVQTLALVLHCDNPLEFMIPPQK